MFRKNSFFQLYLSSTLQRRFMSNEQRFQFKNTNKKKIFAGKSKYALLVAPMTTFCLGIWQVRRWEWKKGLIKELDDKLEKPAVPISLDPENQIEWEKVYVRGEFVHEKTIFIGPRTRLDKDRGPGSLIGNPQTVGSHVVTPFKLEDSDECILVNRGWVPKNSVPPESRGEVLPSGVMTITGLVRIEEITNEYTPKNNPDANKWHSRDIKILSEKLNTLPVFIDADGSTTVANGPIGGQTYVNLPNDHVQYFMTWFSLTALGLFVILFKI